MYLSMPEKDNSRTEAPTIAYFCEEIPVCFICYTHSSEQNLINICALNQIPYVLLFHLLNNCCIIQHLRQLLFDTFYFDTCIGRYIFASQGFSGSGVDQKPLTRKNGLNTI